MTQFGIAHVAIICAFFMTIAYMIDFFPFFVAIGSVAVMLYFAFGKK